MTKPETIIQLTKLVLAILMIVQLWVIGNELQQILELLQTVFPL